MRKATGKRRGRNDRHIAADDAAGIRRVAANVWLAEPEPESASEPTPAPDDFPAGQGAELERWRARAGLTVAQAARAFRVTTRTWYRWVGGAGVPEPAMRLRLNAAIERQRKAL